MNLIVLIGIVIIVAFFLTELSRRYSFPVVISLILAGLLVSIPPIKKFLLTGHEPIVELLGNIGILCLMFLAGLESSWKILSREKTDALYLALISSVVSFGLGFGVFLLLGFSPIVALIVGIALSITAEATRAQVLLELKKLRTRVGSAMMGAGIIDDILGLLLFILVTTFSPQAHIQEDMLIAGAIIAFFLGVVVPTNVVEKQPWAHTIERGLLITIVPFFFLSMGLSFDFSSLLVSPLLLGIILVLAIAGKLIGSFATKPFIPFSNRQILLMGWAMNSRGAIELVIILLAFKANLLPVEIYSSLVIMTFVTTLLFPYVITKMIKRFPTIMD